MITELTYLTTSRLNTKPHLNFYKDQHRAHWLADEVPLASDLNDWKLSIA
jgi:ribonucleotide reductase beta subunit family protein with ferritin-like domain